MSDIDRRPCLNLHDLNRLHFIYFVCDMNHILEISYFEISAYLISIYYITWAAVAGYSLLVISITLKSH